MFGFTFFLFLCGGGELYIKKKTSRKEKKGKKERESTGTHLIFLLSSGEQFPRKSMDSDCKSLKVCFVLFNLSREPNQYTSMVFLL